MEAFYTSGYSNNDQALRRLFALFSFFKIGIPLYVDKYKSRT